MSTCDGCRHWKPPSERDGYGDAVMVGPPAGQLTPEGFTAARGVQVAADMLFGSCRAITLRELEMGEPVPLAVTMDASQYQATLYTQATFGCAMWEQAV